LLVFVFATSLLVAEDESPWYTGKKIVAFENIGLQNVLESTIEDIQYKYVGQTFTDDLFNQLQGELYGLDQFLYFLADAQRTGEGNNDLKIAMTFYELPYVGESVIEGNDGISKRSIDEVLTVEDGSFLQDQQLETSRQAIVDLYQQRGYPDVSVTADYVTDNASNKATITYRIEEGQQQKIGEIQFEGNDKFGADQLKKQIESKATSYFNAGYYDGDTIESDKQKLLEFYRNNGFVDVEVQDVRTEDISEEDDKFTRLRVIFPIEEGPQWKFGGIEVEGNEVFSDEQFQKQIKIPVGSILDYSEVQAQISAVADLYWNNGYIFNTLSTEEIRDEETLTIKYVLTVVENQQAIIEDIRLEGLTKTKPYVFLRELTFEVGDVFSKEKLIKSAQNIYNTLIVTDVQFDILNGTEEGKVIPVFTITEGNQMDIQFGATFGGDVDDEFPVSGFVQWSDKNLGGTGRDMTVSTTLSPDTQSISISFTDGWVGDQRWSNGLTFSFKRNDIDDGLQTANSGDYYTGHEDDDFTTPYPLGYDSYLDYLAADEADPDDEYLMEYIYYRTAVTYSTGYTFMFDEGSLSTTGSLTFGLNRAFYDEDLYDPYEWWIYKYGLKWQFSNNFTLGFSWDGRDLIQNTTKGYVASQKFTYAGGFLGGLSNYIKSATSLSAYVSLFTFTLEDRPAHGVLGYTTSVNFMFPQYYYNEDDDGWGWHDPKLGATKYEMLYIDGMNIGRGFDVVYDQAFLYDNQLSLSAPIVQNVVSWEIFASATAVADDLSDFYDESFPLDWYFAMGAGIKLKITGFPLGLYLVKNATYTEDGFAWESGSIFTTDSDTSGLKLVLAITTTLY
jgi:outer membrane protein insertion porin family